jgi:hypothetical protein
MDFNDFSLLSRRLALYQYFVVCASNGLYAICPMAMRDNRVYRAAFERFRDSVENEFFITLLIWSAKRA